MTLPKKKSPPASLGAWLKTNQRSYRWLGDRLGISIAQVSRIVRGLNMPRAELALEIQKLTGVTVEQLAKARASMHDGDESRREARIKHGRSLIERGQAIVEAATK